MFNKTYKPHSILKKFILLSKMLPKNPTYFKFSFRSMLSRSFLTVFAWVFCARLVFPTFVLRLFISKYPPRFLSVPMLASEWPSPNASLNEIMVLMGDVSAWFRNRRHIAMLLRRLEIKYLFIYSVRMK